MVIVLRLSPNFTAAIVPEKADLCVSNVNTISRADIITSVKIIIKDVITKAAGITEGITKIAKEEITKDVITKAADITEGITKTDPSKVVITGVVLTTDVRSKADLTGAVPITDVL